MRVITFALVLVLAAPSPAQQQPAPKAKPDTEAIQGTWSIIGLEAGAKASPEKNYRGNSFTFGKDRVTLREGVYQAVDFTYTLDSTKTPKAIDLTTGKGGGSSTLKGIYKLEGDDLVLCLSLGGMRPTEFATKAGGETETFTLKRVRWERYTNQATGFVVEMPGKPEERIRMADTPAGPVTTTFLVVRHDPDRVSYLVSVTPLPGKLTGKVAEAALDAAQAALVAEFDKTARTKSESEQPKFKPPAGLGKELTITLAAPDGKDRGTIRMRLFIVGDHLYALAAAGVEEGARSPNVSRFWDSFRLPRDKKNSPRK